VWYHLLPYRRRVIRENLAVAFPDLTPAERGRLARAACRHLVLALLEFLRIPRYVDRGIGEVAEIRGIEHAERAFALGKGVVCVTGHLGSFEVGAAAIAQHLGEGQVCLVVKSFPPGVEELVTAIRRRAGLGLLGARGSMRGILKALREGRGVVFVLDQNATRRQGVFVDFFGHPACTMSALALVAMKTGAPVVPVAIFREGRRHVVQVFPVISLEQRETREAALIANTQKFTRFIEEAIRRHPEQWLWTHKRWRTRPPAGG
jgi:KDO2-lipid IV(A) lauroyltransferase